MRSLISKYYILLFCLTLISTWSHSQGIGILPQIQNSSKSTDTVKAEVKPIPLSDINKASISSYTLYGRSTSRLLKQPEKRKFINRVDQLVEEADKYFSDTVGLGVEKLNYRELEKLSSNLLLISEKINKFQDQINERLIELQSGHQEVQKNKQRWTLTLSNKVKEDTPNTVVKRIGSVIFSSDSVLRLFQSDIDFLLTQTDKLTDQEIRLDMFESDLDERTKYSSKNFLRRDMPTLWGIFSNDSINKVAFSNGFFAQFKDETRTLIAKYANDLLILSLLVIAVFLLIYWLKRNVKEDNTNQKELFLSLYINEIFKKPIEVSLLVSIYFLYLFIPDIPAIYGTLLAIVTVVAIFRVASEILPPGYRMLLIGFSVSFLFFRVFGLFYEHMIFSRFLLLAAQIIALLYLLHYLNNRRLIQSNKNDLLNKVFSFMNVAFIFFISIAILGNIAGTVSFSEFLTGGIVKSGFFFISTYIGFQVSVAFSYLLLSSPLLYRSNIIKAQSDFLLGKVYQTLRLVFILVGIFVFFDQFNVKEPIVEWGSEFLNNQLSIGKAEFTLINIITFVFVIWLSIFISRVVRHILHEEVFTRVEVARGMPGTITMLVRISLVTIGFLLAATAAGLALSNLTIIVGAFSVGIGFGLQNIFNNLVSGLILAFERPIKEGDVVEVNSLLGTVKKIGIRSSIIKTFDGAEVIVPNGSLISNDLINWTLADQNRRADIRIGVAYGTDPEAVIKILVQCAEENTRVLGEPRLKAYFIGFGDSSLDFRLLAWIDMDHRLEVESEIRVDINRKLKEAGIEIPFPQRDVHFKSVTDQAGKILGGKK